MKRKSPDCFEFGPYRLIPAEGLLLRDGEPVALPPKVIDTLVLLVDRNGHVVSKDEFMAAVWPDTYVEETNLTHNISLLRKTLGEHSEDEQFIDTIPKRGYRFVAPVRVVGAETERDIVPGPVETGERRPRTAVGAALWAGLALMVAVAAGLFYRDRTAVEIPTTIRTLAVLPFEPLVPAEGEEDYLGLGLADRLIGQLAGAEEIVVRPTSTVRNYAGRPRDLGDIGHALEVDAVLDGSLQQDESRVRLSVQLVRVADGATLWATSFEQPLGDLYQLQDSLAAELADTLELHLTADRRPTTSPEAYRLYLQARHAWNRRTPEALAQSVTYLQRAISLDPGFALAYSGLADAYNLQADYGIRPPRETYALAMDAARRALELDESLAEAHTALAFALLYHDWDWVAAEQEFERAITLSPNYASAYQWSAYPLMVQGRFDEALARVRRAQELDPVSPIIPANLALALYQARRPGEAVTVCRRAIRLDPTFHVGHWILGLGLGQLGRHDEAVDALERARELAEASPDVTAALAYAYGRAGHTDDARRLLSELRERSASQYVPAYLLAVVHVGLGENDDAFHWLEIALRERQPYMLYLAVEPTLDPIRTEPRYPDLLRRAGLPVVEDRSAT